MDSIVSKDPEQIGYRILYRFFRRIGRKFLTIADHIHFTLYRIKFGQRDDDIYIITYPKSGTTMMQMILYQLTTNGNLDFNHIYDVSPWIRNHAFKKKEPLELQSPRLIKSHDGYKTFDKYTKGRFIFVYRNGMDVAVSQYNQAKCYVKHDLTFDEFAKEFLDIKSKGSWFRYNKLWLENKWKRHILYVRYEDLLSDKRKQINRIIGFCQFKVDKASIERAIEYSSFDFMKKHETKFGEQPPSDPSNVVYDQFIRKGKVGEGESTFNAEQKTLFNSCYEKLVKKPESLAFSK